MTLHLTLPPRLRLRTRVPVAPAGRMAWTRRGDRLIIGGATDTIIVDAASGRALERWPHAYGAFACAYEDSFVAAGNARGYVDLWRFGRTRPGEPRHRHDGAVTALAFSDDDRRIFSAGDDGRVGIWRAATLEAAFVAVGGRAHDLAYDGAADLLAVAAGRAGVVLLDGASGEPRGGVRPPDRATAVTWAGGVLYVGTRDGQLAAYDPRRLEPVRPTGALGVGAIARLLPLGDGVMVEGAGGIVWIEAASGSARLRWTPGVAVAGGSLAVHQGLGALALAVPAAAAILDVVGDGHSEVAVAAPSAPEVLALYHLDDALLAGGVLHHLTQAGAQLSDGARDAKLVVEAARRGATAVVLYGPSGPAPRHDYQIDVLNTHGARIVPVILPGGVVPATQRLFHGAAYVCFHERVHDPDALARVARAVLPGGARRG